MRSFARVVLLMLLCGAAQAEVAIPPWNHYVIDLTDTLTPGQVQALEQRLGALEARKGAQIGVLIVPTTKPETIFQYTMRVFDSWKPGRKGIDDGLLLTIAKNDDWYFLMTGYGMEGPIPDVRAKHIVMDIIIPNVKRAGYYAGIDAGVTAIAKIIESEPLPPPARRADTTVSDDPSGFMKFLGGFILIALLGITVRHRYTARLKVGNSDSASGNKSGVDRVSGDH